MVRKTVLVATRMELAERKQIRVIAAQRGMSISEHLADVLRRDLRRRTLASARATDAKSGDGPFVASTPGTLEAGVVGTPAPLLDSVNGLK